MSERLDVIVAGGGPAGSLAAIVLARAGLRVRVLEKCPGSRFHIGESLLPETIVQFRRLGLLDGLLALPHVHKPGATIVSATGDAPPAWFRFADALRVNESWAVSLEREPFDAWMLAEATNAGAEVRGGTAVRSIERLEENDVRVVADDGEHRARILLDATGQACVVARHLGTRRPLRSGERVAYGMHGTGIEPDPGAEGRHTVIVVFDEGWFWLIPIDGTRTSLGVVMPAGLARDRGIAANRVVRWAIDQAPEMRRRCADANLPETNLVTSDYAYRCSGVAGPGFMLVGDASGFIDPIFSGGVCSALLGAEWAADAAVDVVRNGARWDRRTAAYAKRVTTMHDTLQRLVEHYYTPGYRDLLMHGSGPLQMPRALMELLSGAAFPSPRPAVRWRVALMNASAAVQNHVSIVPPQPRLSLSDPGIADPDQSGSGKESTPRAGRRLPSSSTAAGMALLIASIFGCATPMTTDADLGPVRTVDELVAVIATQSGAPVSYVAECRVTLTDGDGGTARLDGVLLSTDDHLRLQLWRFGETVLDVIDTPDGAWIAGARADRLDARSLPQAWRALSHELLTGGIPKLAGTAILVGDEFHAPIAHAGRDATLRIDARTLQARGVVADWHGQSVRIELSGHTGIGSRDYPTRIMLDAGGDRIEIRIHRAEPEAPMPPTAFIPPPGARPLAGSGS